MTDITVRDNTAEQRFEGLIGDELAGFTEYEITDGVQVMPHTVTLSDFRGRGVARVVVEAGLQAAREAGRTVRPDCSYVRRVVEEDPRYSDLLVG
ncbi:GNAT family N-acetyltransferase [Kytococcus sp. Marseille-QA3725]